jgi:DNA polymerase-3 subunit alpha
LLQNQFVYFKINVKEGWVNRETGKKSDPRIQFLDAKMLADVLPTFAKKLFIHLDIKDLHSNFVTELNNLFAANAGDNSVTFEVMELEKIKTTAADVSLITPIDVDEEVIDEAGEDVEMNIEVPVEKEEIIVKTKLSMPSRKLKVKISSELLQELEKMQVNFKLNYLK